jgi:RimJ/RimL family protein N-acetyltransferase
VLAEESFLKIKEKLVSKNNVPKPFVSAEGFPFCFKWIFECDSNRVLELRNARSVLDMMAVPERILPEEHATFIKNYGRKPRLDFMIVQDEDCSCVGGVSLNLTSRGLEIGKYIGDARFLGQGIAKAAMQSFLQYLQVEFGGNEIIARTRRDNLRNIKLNQKLGFSHCDAGEGDFILMKLVLK